MERNWQTPVLVLGVVVGAGLVLPAMIGGALSDAVGSMLYAGMIYVLVLLVAPGLSAPVATVLALGICSAVELFQLTPCPGELSERIPAAHLVLGTGFERPDLVAYLAGAAVSGLVQSRADVKRRAGTHAGLRRICALRPPDHHICRW